MMVNDVISYSLYNDTGFTWERGLELTALLLMRRAQKKKDCHILFVYVQNLCLVTSLFIIELWLRIFK